MKQCVDRLAHLNVGGVDVGTMLQKQEDRRLVPELDRLQFSYTSIPATIAQNSIVFERRVAAVISQRRTGEP